LESRFAEIAESQPELLARHYAESGQVEKEATQWGKAGQRSLARSALVESSEQLSRALALIASLPSTPATVLPWLGRTAKINFPRRL
jgi:predicted ATPase